MTAATKPLIVITGASSGIGAAMAQRFSEAGHPLLLLARRLDKIEALGLPNALCRAVDVTDAAAFRAAITEAETQYGPTDCLINNAGVMLLGQIDTQDAGEWQKMFNVNVLALLTGMQAVLGDMKARNSGTIINISSIAGKKSFPNHAAYVGTKFAVSSISENVREEVADSGVRVMTICPVPWKPNCWATPPARKSSTAMSSGKKQWAACWRPMISPGPRCSCMISRRA